MTALAHVSASQIKDFKACNRLWYYTRILKQRAPQTEAQSRGTTVHGALEAHLKAGAIEPEILERAKGLGITENDLNDYIEAMKPFVGEPGEGLTEFRDSMPTFEGGPEYVLVVDHAREITIEGCGVVPQIDDLKTTSNFRYCKTPDELSKDVQMVSYAKWALWRLFELKNLPPPNFVSLRHVYVRTRGKRIATARDVLVTPADVEVRWLEILDTVRDMVTLGALGAEVNPQDVPATTTDHCSAYGGCFFRAQCFGAVYDKSRPFLGLFDKEKKENVMSEGNNVTPITSGARLSLKDRVAARKSGGAVAAPAAAPVTAPVVPVAPVAAPVAATVAAPAVVCGVTHPMLPQCPCTLVPHEGDHESKNAQGGVVHWSWDNASMGMGASSNWKALAAAPAVAPAVAPTAASIVAGFDPAAIAQVLPPDAASRTSTPEEVAAAGATKRKRATKAEMEARAAGTPTAPAGTAPDAVAVAAAAIVAKTVDPVAATALATMLQSPTAVASVCPLKELYVDCMPVKGVGAVGLAEDILHSLSADAAKAANMPDWRLVEFGKGKGAMAVLLRERLASMPEILVVSSSTPGSDVIIEVLTPHARRVVRALRG